MANKKRSIQNTAFRVTFGVALEQYEPVDKRIVQDDLAKSMLPAKLQRLVKLLGNRWLRDKWYGLLNKISPGMRAIMCRMPYIDQHTIEGIKDGCRNVVILGCGMDTRAYRLPELKAVTVYELDMPEVIAFKEKRIRALFGEVPGHVRLIPIDFAEQTVGEALAGQGFPIQEKSFYIWEGVTQYLNEDSVRRMFAFLKGAATGSRLLFTYILQDFIDGTRTFKMDRLYTQSRRKRDAIWKFGMLPEQVQDFIGEYGWKVIEQVGAEDYRRLYLEPRGRGEQGLEIERTVAAEKARN